MRKMIAVLVGDSPGVLARVAGLFARRGYNIDSLAVGTTDRPSTSRMTIAFQGDETVKEQVSKQLYKLIDVYKVSDLDAENSVVRELALVRVHCEPARRPQVVQLADLFRARVVDVSRNSMIIETSGTQEKVEALIQLLRDFGLQEVVRTGPIALERGMAKAAPAEITPLSKAVGENDVGLFHRPVTAAAAMASSAGMGPGAGGGGGAGRRAGLGRGLASSKVAGVLAEDIAVNGLEFYEELNSTEEGERKRS